MGEANIGVKQRITFTGTHEITVAADDIHEGIGTAGVVTLNGDYDWMSFQINNTDAEALDQMDVQVKFETGADFVSLYTTWGTNIAGQQFATAALESLAATTEAAARVNMKGVHSFRFRMSSAVAASDVDLEGTITRDSK